MSSSLSVKNVTKKFDDNTVINDLSFDVDVGEFIVLVGPSGCGKSTMLRMVAGLEDTTSGKVIIGDKDVTNFAPKDRHIAMVFQDYALYPHKNVYENIAFGLRIRKFPKDEIDKRVKEAAAKLDLMEYLERKPAALSGGQRQRVAIGRAIVRDPQVFLFDEPLSNLDAKLRGSMRLTISKLHKELNATVVYVTHDQVEAMTLADKIVVLNGGIIQQMGTPLDLYYHPKNIFVATFIGSPAMNLIDGVVKTIDGKLGFTSNTGIEFPFHPEALKTLTAKEGQGVTWGFRAENMKYASENTEGPRFNANVVVTELLGATTSVLCESCGHEFTVNLPAPHRPKRGSEIELVFSSKHLYLFDKASGENLTEKQ